MAPEMSYMACDPDKLARARKAAMNSSMEKDKDKYETEKIFGIRYDGRRNKQIRAMVSNIRGKLKMRMWTKEHEYVTNEPSGRYLSHFTPETQLTPYSS